MAKKVPRGRYPKAIELDYFRQIKRLYRSWWAESVGIISRQFNIRLDSDKFYMDDIWDDLTQSWNVKVIGFIATIKETAGKVIAFNGRNMSRQIKSVTGINIIQADPWRAIEIDRFAEINARLIQNLGQQTVLNVSRLVTDKVIEGTSLRQLTADIGKVIKTYSTTRPALIARDQVGKLNGRITQLRQTELGIKKFIWQTAGDKRVRKAHVALEGKEFNWKTGAPGEGIPGEPIQCRCIAEPVFSEDFLNVGVAA